MPQSSLTASGSRLASLMIKAVTARRPCRARWWVAPSSSAPAPELVLQQPAGSAELASVNAWPHAGLRKQPSSSARPRATACFSGSGFWKVGQTWSSRPSHPEIKNHRRSKPCGVDNKDSISPLAGRDSGSGNQGVDSPDGRLGPASSDRRLLSSPNSPP